METTIPSGYWGLCEAVLDTRNILRSLAAARGHGTIFKAHVQVKDELERMKNDDADWPDNAWLHGSAQTVGIIILKVRRCTA